MKHAPLLLALTTLCLTLTGCGQGPRGGSSKGMGHPVPPPIEPEKPRPAKATPIDPALQAAARAELAKGAEAGDFTTRIHALEAMRETLGADAGPAILRGLDDPSEFVRFAAAMAAGELALPDAKDKLATLANDRDASVAVAARFALHRLGDTRLSNDLVTAAVSADYKERFATAMVLGRMGEPSAIKILRTLRFDRNPGVRQQASDSLYRLGDEAGLTDLIGLAASQHPDDMMIGMMGLTARGDHRLVEHVRAGLTTDWPEVQLVAARAVGLIGQRPRFAGDRDYVYDLGLPIALRNVKSNDPRIRVLAALAIGAIGRSDTQAVLATLLKDENQSVRIAAASAVLQVGKQGQ